MGQPLCAPGVLNCRGGMLVCEGGTRGHAEVCNCLDDNCNGMVDEGDPASLCPGGGACVMCACRTQCRDSEFPCRIGQRCSDPINPRNGYCIDDQCGDAGA